MSNAKTIGRALKLNDEAIQIIRLLFQPIGMVVKVDKLNRTKAGYVGVVVTLAGGADIKVAVRSYEKRYEEVGVAYEFATDLPAKGASVFLGRPGQWDVTKQRGCQYQLHVWKTSGFAALIPISSLDELRRLAASGDVAYNLCLTKDKYSAYVKIPYAEFVQVTGVVARYFKNPEGTLFDFMNMEKKKPLRLKHGW